MKKVKAPKKNILNRISQKGLQKPLEDGQPVHVLESAHQVRKSMSYAEAMNEFSEKEYEGLLRTFKLITIVTVIALLLILAHPSIMEAINNIK